MVEDATVDAGTYKYAVPHARDLLWDPRQFGDTYSKDPEYESFVSHFREHCLTINELQFWTW